ncbi:MAG: M48 family metallopeptidase [Solirubrobacteraceae bacterium]
MGSKDAALPIEYTVRRSTRARRVSVKVDAHAGVEVVLPQRAPERAAAAAVRELRPWIERRERERERTRAQLAARAGSVPYLGELLTLVPQDGRSRVRRDGDRLLVPQADPKPALERFYRASARREIGGRLDAAAASVGERYASLSIRCQRTRWASCSASGAMSFNWRLVLAPEPVLAYVIWHEICHLSVRDHSPRFWALLAERRPSWRAERDWLRANGQTLVL